MKEFHIEIDISKDGDMFIVEDGCTGTHYHINEEYGIDDLFDEIATCLEDYLHLEYDDRYADMKEGNMTYKEFLKKKIADAQADKIELLDMFGLHTCTDAKPSNIMSTDGELKQWQNDVMERNSIMSKDEVQAFLKPKNDPVNHPSHYTDGKIEVIDFIEDKRLNFHLANAVKYISRAGKKDPSKEIEDLKKARWYLDRYIQKLEGDNDVRQSD